MPIFKVRRKPGGGYETTHIYVPEKKEFRPVAEVEKKYVITPIPSAPERVAALPVTHVTPLKAEPPVIPKAPEVIKEPEGPVAKWAAEARKTPIGFGVVGGAEWFASGIAKTPALIGGAIAAAGAGMAALGTSLATRGPIKTVAVAGAVVGGVAVGAGRWLQKPEVKAFYQPPTPAAKLGAMIRKEPIRILAAPAEAQRIFTRPELVKPFKAATQVEKEALGRAVMEPVGTAMGIELGFAAGRMAFTRPLGVRSKAIVTSIKERSKGMAKAKYVKRTPAGKWKGTGTTQFEMSVRTAEGGASTISAAPERGFMRIQMQRPTIIGEGVKVVTYKARYAAAGVAIETTKDIITKTGRFIPRGTVFTVSKAGEAIAVGTGKKFATMAELGRLKDVTIYTAKTAAKGVRMETLTAVARAPAKEFVMPGVKYITKAKPGVTPILGVEMELAATKAMKAAVKMIPPERAPMFTLIKLPKITEAPPAPLITTKEAVSPFPETAKTKLYEPVRPYPPPAKPVTEVKIKPPVSIVKGIQKIAPIPAPPIQEPIVEPIVTPIPAPPKQMPIIKPITKPKEALKIVPKTLIPALPVAPGFTLKGMLAPPPISLPGLGGGMGWFARGRKAWARKTKYTPSLAAMWMGKRVPKIPKFKAFTGYEIRPMVAAPAKRRPRRKRLVRKRKK